MSEATVTTDYDEIRRWAEARGARPAIIGAGQGAGGILRFDFGDDDARLAEVPWEEFFRVFDEKQLALLHQEETVSGQQSRFFRFVDRNAGSSGTPRTEGQTAMEEPTETPMAERQADAGDRPYPAQDRAEPVMIEMEEETPAITTGDQMDEALEPPRRQTTRRPATKRASAKRTPARSTAGRATRSSSKRASPARKTASRKTSSTSRSTSRLGARKTASRKAAAKKTPTKRKAAPRRNSVASSRSRSAKRSSTRRSR